MWACKLQAHGGHGAALLGQTAEAVPDIQLGSSAEAIVKHMRAQVTQSLFAGWHALACLKMQLALWIKQLNPAQDLLANYRAFKHSRANTVTWKGTARYQGQAKSTC